MRRNKKSIGNLQEGLISSNVRFFRMIGWQVHRARLHLNPNYPEEAVFRAHCDRLDSDPAYKAWWDEEVKKLA